MFALFLSLVSLLLYNDPYEMVILRLFPNNQRVDWYKWGVIIDK